MENRNGNSTSQQAHSSSGGAVELPMRQVDGAAVGGDRPGPTGGAQQEDEEEWFVGVVGSSKMDFVVAINK